MPWPRRVSGLGSMLQCANSAQDREDGDQQVAAMALWVTTAATGICKSAMRASWLARRFYCRALMT